MKVNGRIIKRMATAYSDGQMAAYMKAYSKITCSVVMVSLHGVMANHMMDNGN